MKRPVLAALAGGVLLVAGTLAAQVVEATPTLKLSDGTTTITIEDNGAGDLSSAEGVIIFYGAIGLFTINVTTGLSEPASGTVTNPIMELNSVNVLGAGAGTLTITFTDVDFVSTSSGSGLLSSIGGVTTSSPGGTNPGTVTFETYIESGGTVTLLASQVFGPGAFSGEVSSTTSLGAGLAYSLTEVVTLTLLEPGNASFNATLAATPEPASLLLLGTGLVGLGFLTKRKKHRT